MSTSTEDVEGLKEHVSQLKFELAHYKTNNEELISKLAKSERQLSKANKYNEELREQIELLSKEVHEYRKGKCDNTLDETQSVSASSRPTDVGVQVGEDDFEMVFESKALPSWNSGEKKDPSIDTTSIADVIKATAEAVLQTQTGAHPQADSTTNPNNQQDFYSKHADTSSSQYYYDENSQMYYDYNSGYYIDTKNNLYYDPNSGTYFYFNKETNSYEFHSQIDLKNTSCEQQSQVSRSCSAKKRGRHRRESTKNKEMDKKNHSKRKKCRSRKSTPTIKKKKKKKKSHKHKKKLKKLAEDGSFRKKKIGEISVDVGASCTEESEKIEDNSSVRENFGLENENCESGLEDKTDKLRNETMDVDDNVMNTNTLQEDETDAEKICVKNEADDTESDDDSDSVCSDESELESGELSCDYSTDDKSDSDVICDEDFFEDENPPVDSNPEILRQFVPYTGDEKYLVSSEAAASWPPCIRAIVKESDCLDAGDLSIITCVGGSIGRDKGKNHLIIINDINTSRKHCSVWFDYDSNQYVVLDEGSQHGTYLNNQRLSKPNERSEETGIHHGDVLRISSTVFLLHIHPGHDTCDECEPGEVKAKIEKESEIKNDIVIMSAEEKKKQRKAELNSIKKRYGLKNMAFVDNVEALNNPEYKDRATVRRKNVGSDCPAQKTDAPASIHRPVSEKNKGHKMLSKLGWKEGEGLGKTSDGITEPITVSFRKNQSAGLGSTKNVFESMDNVDEKSAKKTNVWLQAQERYDKIAGSNSVNASDSVECSEKPAEIKTKMTWVKAQNDNTDNT